MTQGNEAETPLYEGSYHRLLYFCRQNSEDVIGLEDQYKIDITGNTETPFDVITQEAYDLILLDDDLFGDNIYMMILELKRWDWALPVIVLTSEEEVIYQTNLMEAGADDILVKNYSHEYLAQRLNLCLKRNEQNHRYIQAERKLFEIMMLTRQLHAFTDPQALIEGTIKIVCDSFDLYGMVVAIPEDGIIRVYSGRGSDHQSEAVILQLLREAKPNEPLSRSIGTNLVELFDDISRDPHYIAPSNLPHAQSAVVIPLQHQADSLGTMALFGKRNEPFNSDDLQIYEMLATQFTLALRNAYFSRAQYRDIHSNQMLLKAWQSIFKVETAQEIAKTLCTLVGGLPSVDVVMVWIAETEGVIPEVFTSGPYENAEQILLDLLSQVDFLASIFNANYDPHTISKLGLSPSDPLQPLFRALHSRYLIFTPLEDSARLIGGILVSSSVDQRFDIENANHVKNLALAAGQALERMMLIEAMVEKSGRLEAILRSVTEGIFFVDDTGLIAFCNPQLTELTNVNPSEIIGKKPAALLNLLAEQSVDPDKTAVDFLEAVRSLETIPGLDRTYPIVELTLRNRRRQVDVEFVATDDIRASKESWVGLVRLNGRFGSKWEAPSENIDLLVDTLHASNMDLQRIIDHPVRDRNRPSITGEKSILQEIKKGIDNSEALLEQYSQFKNLDLMGPEWNYETVDLGELLQDIIRVQFNDIQTRIVSEATAGHFCIESDKQLVGRWLSRLLTNVISRTNTDDIINLGMQEEGDEITIHIDSSGKFDLPDSELTLFHLVELDNPHYRESDIFLYLTLIQFYHCRFWIETIPNKARSLVVAFPKAQASSVPSSVQVDPQYAEVLAPVRTPRRDPESVMVIQGRSAIIKRVTQELERENIRLYMYHSPEEAVRDLNLTRLDLLVLDGGLVDEDSMEVCKRIHARSEVPIVMVADTTTNLQLVEALKAGAEDYITEPISKEELLAKFKVLFRRQDFADRTEQPLDLGDLRIDFSRRAVFINQKAVVLTRIEYDLLRTLVMNKGQVLTHQQLLEKVWGPEHRSETQYLWVHLSRLRKKLEPTSYIHNQLGIGYIFQQN